LPMILNAQPEGPYRLGGKCLGAIVAFEAARMLIAAGKEVEMVVMLDPPTFNARRSVQMLFSIMKRARPVAEPIVEYLMAWTWFRGAQLQRFWNYPWSRRAAAIRRRLGAIRAKVTNLVDGRDDPVGAAPKNRYAEQNGDEWQFTDARTSRYAAAMSRYVPKPLAVRVIYIKVDYGFGAWRRISPNFEVVKSPGTHEEPEFDSVAEHLKVRL
jgi:thioesterase domain-containing protein